MLQKIHPLAILVSFVCWGIIAMVAFGLYKTSIFQRSVEQKLVSPLSSSLPQISLDNPPSQSLEGNIVTMEGDISLQSRTATAPAKLIAIPSLLQGESLQTGENGSITFQIANAARISLVSKTQIELAQTLPANIVIVQTQGVGDYTQLSQSPLSVRSMHLLTQIEGDVRINIDSVNHWVSVSVNKGLAQVAFSDQQNQTQVLQIKEGDRFIFDDDNRQPLKSFINNF